MVKSLRLPIAVEVNLRLSAVVLGSVPVLIAAAVALANLKNALNKHDYYDKQYYSLPAYTTSASDMDDDINGKARVNFYTATGLAISLAVLSIAIEVGFIVIRILSMRLVNVKIIIFLLVDTLINFSLAVGYNVCRSLLIPLVDLNYEEKTDKTQADRIRNAISYSAAFSANAEVMFFVLALFIIFFVFKDLSKSEVNAAALNEASTSQL